MMNRTRSAYSRGSPSRLGNGTEAPSESCAACGSAFSIGVPKMPGAIAMTRMPNCDSALSVGEWREVLHVGGDEPHHVEGAGEIDRDDLLELGKRHRAVAADHSFGRTDSGAVDQDAGRTMLVAGFLQRGFGAVRRGDIAA